MPNHYVSWASSVYAGSAQDSDLAYIGGNLSQSEKLSEIKLPLDYQRKSLNQIISM